MPLIRVLNSTQKKEFESPPLIDDEIRAEVFILPRSMELQLTLIVKPINKIHFVAMYGYFKLSHTFYDPTTFFENDLHYIASHYNIDLKEESTAKNTLSLYKQIIRKDFSFLPSDYHLKNILESEADSLITQLTTPKAIFYALIDISLSKRYEVPSYTFLVRIITNTMNRYRNKLFDKMKSLKDHDALTPLELFLQSDESHERNYNLAGFKRISHASSPAKIKESVRIFLTLKNMHTGLLSIIQTIKLDTNIARHYAQWVEKSSMQQLLRKAKHKQQFDLICFVMHQTYMRTDQLCDIMIQSIQSAKLIALREHQSHYYEQRQSRSHASNEMANLLKNNLIPKIYSIKKTLSSNESANEKLRQIQKEIDTMIADDQDKKVCYENHENLNDNEGYYKILEERSRKLQNRVSEIIKTLEFDEKRSNKPLMKAIDFFKTANGNITAKIPIEFLSDEQKTSVFGQNTEDPFKISLYKSLLFIAISDAIKSGTLNLKHSYRYKAFDDYLIDNEIFLAEKERLLERHKLESLGDAANVLVGLKLSLNSLYHTVNTNILQGKNEYFHLKADGSYTVSTPKVQKDREIDSLWVHLPKEKFIPLIEILRRINAHTHFSDKFHHLSNSNALKAPKPNALYAGMIGYGCNISIPKMAKISRGVSHHDIEHIRTWYMSNEMLQEANDTIIAFTQTLDIVKVFQHEAGKNHTASDGQKFNNSVDSLNAGYSFKYFGLGRGVTRYTFQNEAYQLFYTIVINANEREAAYVIDGLMHQEVIKSDIHSTDTFGYSEVIFALTYLLKLQFAPRIKNFKEQQLYAFEAKKLYKNQEFILLPANKINMTIILEQWDQILRFILTIKDRRATASQLLKRLTSYSRKHRLYQALREFGRIIKTLFILEYIDNVELRQQIEKQLNKVENANKFSRAVFFGNSGEYFYATKDEQDIASNSLRLLQNAIICWNYLYISDKLTKEKDEEVRKKIINSLKNGSIIHYQHINFYGEYDFTERDEEEEFDMEAIKRFRIETDDQK